MTLTTQGIRKALYSTVCLVALNVASSAHAEQLGATHSAQKEAAVLVRFQHGAVGRELLTSIVTCLSTKFDLPPIYHHPQVAI